MDGDRATVVPTCLSGKTKWTRRASVTIRSSGSVSFHRVRRSAILLTLAVSSFLFGDTVGRAAPGVHGKSVRAQAQLDARLVHASGPIQVQRRLCTEPFKSRTCVAMPKRLQAALEAAIDVRVHWVGLSYWPGQPLFVFAPVRFQGDRAIVKAGWRQRLCGGISVKTFQRDHGSWTRSGGRGLEACAVSGGA